MQVSRDICRRRQNGKNATAETYHCPKSKLNFSRRPLGTCSARSHCHAEQIADCSTLCVHRMQSLAGGLMMMTSIVCSVLCTPGAAGHVHHRRQSSLPVRCPTNLEFSTRRRYLRWVAANFPEKAGRHLFCQSFPGFCYWHLHLQWTLQWQCHLGATLKILWLIDWLILLVGGMGGMMVDTLSWWVDIWFQFESKCEWRKSEGKNAKGKMSREKCSGENVRGKFEGEYVLMCR